MRCPKRQYTDAAAGRSVRTVAVTPDGFALETGAAPRENGTVDSRFGGSFMNALTKVVAVLAVALLVWPSFAAPVPKDAKDTPLPVGSTWTGKLTQRGGGPTGFDCEFKITKRDGEKFEAELYEKDDDLELTYLVRGTIVPVDAKDKDKGYKLEFKSYDAKDVKNTLEILNVPYSATLKDKKIKGTWKLPDDSEFGKLEGDFEFAPKKD